VLQVAVLASVSVAGDVFVDAGVAVAFAIVMVVVVVVELFHPLVWLAGVEKALFAHLHSLGGLE